MSRWAVLSYIQNDDGRICIVHRSVVTHTCTLYIYIHTVVISEIGPDVTRRWSAIMPITLIFIEKHVGQNIPVGLTYYFPTTNISKTTALWVHSGAPLSLHIIVLISGEFRHSQVWMCSFIILYYSILRIYTFKKEKKVTIFYSLLTNLYN